MSALHVIDIKICTTKKKYVPVFQVEVKFVQLYYAVFIVMFKHVWNQTLGYMPLFC